MTLRHSDQHEPDALPKAINMDTDSNNTNSVTLSEREQYDSEPDRSAATGQLVHRVNGLERRMDEHIKAIDQRFAMLSVQLESICDHLLKFECLVPQTPGIVAVANITDTDIQSDEPRTSISQQTDLHETVTDRPDEQMQSDAAQVDLAEDSVQFPEPDPVLESDDQGEASIADHDAKDDFAAIASHLNDPSLEPVDIQSSAEVEIPEDRTFAEEESVSIKKLMLESADNVDDHLDRLLNRLTSANKTDPIEPHVTLNDQEDLEDVVAEAAQEPPSSDDPNSALNDLFASLAKKNEEEDEDYDREQRQEEPQATENPESFRSDITMTGATELDGNADFGIDNTVFDESSTGELNALQEPISVSEKLLDDQDKQSPSSPGIEPDSELESIFNRLLDQTRIEESDCESDIEQDIEHPETQVNVAQSSSVGQSVADVLARMQAAGALDSNFETFADTTELYAAEDEQPVEEPQSFDRQPLSSFEGDGDGDVNSYMNQLLQRLGTSRQTSQAAPPTEEKPKPIAVRPAAGQVAKVNARPEPPKDVLSAEEFVPKQVAPERSSNLAAMRDIANQSTREAVESSKVRRTKAKITALLGGFAIGIAGAAFLYSLCHKVGDIFFLGAIASLLASGTCAFFLYDEKFGKKEKQ